MPIKNWLIFFLAFALLLGPAYNTYLDYDYQSNPDCNTYMSIANGHFENQSLVRRYRIIVPFLAKGVAFPLEQVYAKLWPHREGTDGPLRLGFLLVNLSLMALTGLIVYKCCKAYCISDAGSLLGMTAVLVGGRWGNLFAAIPLTDSLYILIVSCVVYAIKTRQHKLLASCIIFGPLAKESFVLILPFIFFLSSMPKIQQLLWFALSAVIALSLRYVIDKSTGTAMAASFGDDADHIHNIGITVLRIASPRGIGELCTVLGLFSLLLTIGFTKGKEAINSWTQHADRVIWWLLPVLLIHMLLSTEAARMLYQGAVAWAVMLGLIWDHHPLLKKWKALIL